MTFRRALVKEATKRPKIMKELERSTGEMRESVHGTSKAWLYKAGLYGTVAILNKSPAEFAKIHACWMLI